jgi:hypothetical protein
MPAVAVKHITSILIVIKVYPCSKRLPRSLSVTRSRRQQGLQQCGGKKATFILVVIAGGRPPNLHYLIFRYVSLGKYPPKNLAALIDRFSESTKVLHAFDAIDGNKVERGSER